MQKIICLQLILILILSLCFCSSQGIKVSPTKTILSMKINEQNCTTIWVLPDSNLIVESLWSMDGKGERNKYNLSEKNVGVEINYSRIKYGEYRFCFTGKRQGYFYGLMFFQQKDSLVKIGTWVELDVESENVFEKISLITGNAISHKGSQTDFLLVVVVILLFGILYVLAKRLIFSSKNKHS